MGNKWGDYFVLCAKTPAAFRKLVETFEPWEFDQEEMPALLPSDLVQPGQGGLSVSPDDPLNLPYFRRPPEFQGTGQDPVWVLEASQLGSDLYYRPDPSHAGHGFVEPVRAMTLGDYEAAIIGTQRMWQKEKP
jgi:hypothetical protein